MHYLKLIDLPSTELTKEEEDYLDTQARYDHWCKKNKGRYGRDITEWEAIDAFKEDMYDICMEYIMDGTNKEKEKFKDLLSKTQRKSNEVDVQKAKQFPIEELVRRFGYEPNRQGFITSPFLPEQETGSCKIYPSSNSWYDFGTNHGGDAIEFVTKVNGCTFIEAVNYLT